MKNERTIVLENVSSQAVGVKDTQTRTYRLAPGANLYVLICVSFKPTA